MMELSQPALEGNTRLRAAENLLEQALEDLTAGNLNAAPDILRGIEGPGGRL